MLDNYLEDEVTESNNHIPLPTDSRMDWTKKAIVSNYTRKLIKLILTIAEKTVLIAKTNNED